MDIVFLFLHYYFHIIILSAPSSCKCLPSASSDRYSVLCKAQIIPEGNDGVAPLPNMAHGDTAVCMPKQSLLTGWSEVALNVSISPSPITQLNLTEWCEVTLN